MTSEAEALAAVLAKVTALPSSQRPLARFVRPICRPGCFRAHGRFRLSTTRRWMATRVQADSCRAGARNCASLASNRPARTVA